MHFILFHLFLLLKLSSRSCYHTHHCCMGTTTMAYARGMTTQPHPWAHKPPHHHHILPLAPTPTAAIASFAASYVFFFSFFFVPFLTNITETLFTPHAGPSNPRLSTHNPHHHALPLKPHKSHRCHCFIHRYTSKVIFFHFFFSFLF